MTLSRHASKSSSAPRFVGALAVFVALALLAAPARSDEAPTSADRDYVPRAFTPPLPTPGITPPTLIARVAPLYPDAARRAGIEGTVVVAARIGRDGMVRAAHTEHSIAALDAAALTAVRRYEFTPARHGGLECEAWISAPVHFDASLPTGGRDVARIPVSGESDAEQTFAADVTALRNLPEAPFGTDELELRRQIMQESLALAVIPAPGDEAILALGRGDSLATLPDQSGRVAATLAWSRAAALAPAWTVPPLRLASAAIGRRDYDVARGWASIVLAGRPGDPQAEALFRRAHQLDIGQKPYAPKKGGKKK